LTNVKPGKCQPNLQEFQMELKIHRTKSSTLWTLHFADTHACMFEPPHSRQHSKLLNHTTQLCQLHSTVYHETCAPTPNLCFLLRFSEIAYCFHFYFFFIFMIISIGLKENKKFTQIWFHIVKNFPFLRFLKFKTVNKILTKIWKNIWFKHGRKSIHRNSIYTLKHFYSKHKI